VKHEAAGPGAAGVLAQTRARIASILEQRPAFDYAMSRCLDAWADLSTERPIGFAVGAIPVSKIWAWCDRRGMDSESAEVMEHVIRRLDNERAERQAAADDKKKATGGGKGRR
jgi:hypothetical protein